MAEKPHAKSSYFFLLGRLYELSLAELGSFFGDDVAWDARTGTAAVSKELPLPTNDFLKKLGGSMEVLKVAYEKVPEPALEKTLCELLHKKALSKTSSGKFRFAVNILPENGALRMLRNLLPAIKSNLRNAGISCAFLNNNFHNADRVLIHKEKIITAGASIYAIKDAMGTFTIAESQGVQNVDAYGRRDYDKPFRDAKVGMLPPKLAQVMVNVGIGVQTTDSSNNTITIYDPFCGSGTILMESLLMGINIIGSDNNDRLIMGARENIEWLRRVFNVEPELSATLFPHDAAARYDAGYKLREGTVVVTEPYLGPPLLSLPSGVVLEKIQHELEKLYIAFFGNLAEILNSGAVVVFAFPFWRGQNRDFRISEKLLPEIAARGFSVTTFSPIDKNSLFFSRPDQVVGREIMRFVKR